MTRSGNPNVTVLEFLKRNCGSTRDSSSFLHPGIRSIGLSTRAGTITANAAFQVYEHPDPVIRNELAPI